MIDDRLKPFFEFAVFAAPGVHMLNEVEKGEAMRLNSHICQSEMEMFLNVCVNGGNHMRDLKGCSSNLPGKMCESERGPQTLLLADKLVHVSILKKISLCIISEYQCKAVSVEGSFILLF